IARDEDIYQNFEEFKPFLDGQSTFLWGETYYLRYYFLREEIKKLLINKYHNLDSTMKSNINIYSLTTSPISGYNFDLYDLNEQRWDFDFATSFLNPKINGNEISNIERREIFLDDYPPTKLYSLTELEVQIADGLVGNYDVTQKEIANQLGIHAPNLSTIKTNLLTDKIIGPQLMVNTFLPLNPVLRVTADNKEIIDRIVTLFQKIPYSNVSPVRSITEPDKYQIIIIAIMDDILYSSLVTFLMDLLKTKKIDDFRIGLTVDQYFGMSKVKDILNANL
ncbi:MAG: hypothetical protein ACFFDW_15945, partial [Candidatus Thorarchaeota archaeon]